MTASLNDSDEIARAEAQVAEQRANLTRSLKAASKSGEKFARRLGHELKPAVTAAVVLAGAAAVVGISVALVRRSSRNRGWRAPAQPSLIGNVAKAAGLWALRAVARRVAQELVARLSQPTPAAPALAPADYRTELGKVT
jgi:hypothetical protein